MAGIILISVLNGLFWLEVQELISTCSGKEEFIVNKRDKNSNQNTLRPVLKAENWQRMLCSQRQILHVILSFLSFFRIAHLWWIPSLFLALISFYIFLDFRFSWLLFPFICHNNYLSSYILWQPRVHYFCHYWKVANFIWIL